MRSTILGVGHYVPTKVVTNDDLAKLMATSDEWIVQRTGIKERRYIEHSGIGASDLAVPASEMALEHAKLKKSDIDAIIFATLSPDHNFPGAGCFLGHKLGMPGIPALDVRNQCSGFLYGLSIADAWVRAGVYKNVLLVGSEVHSTGVEFTDRGRDVAVLFGDGAGAAIIGAATKEGQGLKSIKLHADGSGAKDLWTEAPASNH
ncbi:MAG TPA: 3-oxoacyl-ACP synthase, partial [Polyangiaceae bacterium]